MTRTTVTRVAGVLVGFVVAGALLGVLWAEVVWTPATGRVVQGRWVPTDEESLAMLTGGTSTYVAVAAVGALVLGLAAALLAARVELGVLVAVLVGSVAAALLMWWVGTALGPPDPATAARSAEEGARLPGPLTVSGVSPFLVWPGVALTALTVVFLASPEAGRREAGLSGSERG